MKKWKLTALLALVLVVVAGCSFSKKEAPLKLKPVAMSNDLNAEQSQVDTLTEERQMHDVTFRVDPAWKQEERMGGARYKYNDENMLEIGVFTNDLGLKDNLEDAKKAIQLLIADFDGDIVTNQVNGHTGYTGSGQFQQKEDVYYTLVTYFIKADKVYMVATISKSEITSDLEKTHRAFLVHFAIHEIEEEVQESSK